MKNRLSTCNLCYSYIVLVLGREKGSGVSNELKKRIDLVQFPLSLQRHAFLQISKLLTSDHLSSVCVSFCVSIDFFSRTTGPISTKIGTKHSWVRGIQVNFVKMKDHAFFQAEKITKKRKYIDEILQSHWANFNQTWGAVSLGGRNSSLFKLRVMSISKER